MSKDYLPRRQSELDAWLDNFITVFPAIAKTLGFADDEIATIVALLQNQRTAFSSMNIKRKESAAAAAAYDDVATAAEGTLRRAVQRMKTHIAFTEELGKTMDVITMVDSTKLVSQQMPELHLALEGGKIVVRFKKHGLQGVKIYSRRGTETEFTFLAVDTSSPYEDNRPNLVPGQPEKREYIAYFIDNDEQVGSASAVYSIMF